MTTAKNEDFTGLTWKLFISVGGNEPLVEESTRGVFTGGGGMTKFLASRGGIYPIPPAANLVVLPKKKSENF